MDQSALTACDREPIHLSGAIQPHGALVAASWPDLVLTASSTNASAVTGLTLVPGSGLRLDEALAPLSPALAPALRTLGEEDGATFLGTFELPNGGGTVHDAIGHRRAGSVILEFEIGDAAGDESRLVLGRPSNRIRSYVERLQAARDVPELLDVAAAEIREVTEFDRALIYQFDASWHGAVIAESRNDELPAYLGLRFPASDIPAQARELYRRNRVRIIPDAGYDAVPIEPNGTSMDLSRSVLRSVSPVHVAYMRNMGTGASMSVSIVINGELWGLVSCHNKAPKHVGFHARATCDFAIQILALQLAARLRDEEASRRLQLGAIQTRLLARMAQEDGITVGLTRSVDDLLGLTSAGGCAILSGESCTLVGQTLPEPLVRRLAEWLSTRHAEDDVFATETLGDILPEALGCADRASGALAISISKKYARYIVWFRPELVQTVSWAGNPAKPVLQDAGGLNPRRSFEIWKETVQGRSEPWSQVEVEAVRELRNAVVGIVLRRAEELAAVSEELQRSNRELEAFSYSVSHDLRAPFRHIVGYSELLRKLEGDALSDKGRRYLDTITESAFAAGNLVDSLLAFSQMGRTALTKIDVDMNILVAETRDRVLRDAEPGRSFEWSVADLPKAHADPVMLRLVFENLLSNAVKYTRGREPARIEVRCERRGEEAVFSVTDNGVGFDMAYVGKLFGVFQRLHRMEEFEGTGIGLANVRRIVERHGGRVWAEGRLGQGAAFHLTLPSRGTSGARNG
jgi:light-regulated signal transduction histidine kinase (bacteriophytochrome)